MTAGASELPEPEPDDRELPWPGAINARDLGGLPLGADAPVGAGGGTLHGRVFRSAKPDRLGEAGWRALEEAGIRTVVDLRSDWEVAPLPLRPASIAGLRRPVEDVDDTEFMRPWQAAGGGPRMWSAAIARWPGRVADAVAAIADAPADGAVLVHCSAGRDRTGMLVALLLSAAGVEREAILDDYARAVRGIARHFGTDAYPAERPLTSAELDERIATTRRDLEGFLDRVPRIPELDRAAARLTG